MHKPSIIRNQYGYMLLPVVMALSLVALAAWFMNRTATLQLDFANSHKKTVQNRYMAEAALSRTKWFLRTSDNCSYRAGIKDASFPGGTYNTTITENADKTLHLVATLKFANGQTQTLTDDFICSELTLPKSFYWTDIGLPAVRTMEMYGNAGLKNLVTSDSGVVLPKPLALANDKIYWGDDNSIYRASTNGSGFTELLDCGFCKISGLGVAPDEKKIYWTDNFATGILWYADLSEQEPDPKILINDAGIDASAMEVDWKKSKIFWADQSLKSLKSATLNGTNMKTVPIPQNKWSMVDVIVTALALDTDNSKIYFFDKKLRSICRVNYDGKNYEVLLPLGGSTDIKGLKLDAAEYSLYWTDTNDKTIKTAKMGNDGKWKVETVKTFEEGETPWGLCFGPHPAIAIPRTKGPYWVSTSSAKGFGNTKNKLKRSELDGTNIVTVLSSKETLLDLTVDAAKDRLYWTTNNKQIRTSNIDGSNITTVHNCSESNDCRACTGFAIDTVKQQFYLLDQNEKKIFRGELAGGGTLVTIVSGLKTPKALALDLVSAPPKIYWSDSGDKAIKWANINNMNETGTLLSGVGQNAPPVRNVLALALDPVDGKIYWYSDQTRKIYRADLMDGSNTREVVTDNIGNLGRLTIDQEERKLYWTDNGTKTVNFAKLDPEADGTFEKTILVQLSDYEQPTGITIVPASQ